MSFVAESGPHASRAKARAILGLLALLMACSDDKPLTQIVVAVDSDWDGLSRIEIQIEGFTKATTVVATLGKGKPALPRRVVLVHDGGPLGPLSVTVRAYQADTEDPIAIEPRTGIRFVEGKTRLLKVDLLLECIRADMCKAGQACVAGPTCVSSAEAAKLVPWDGAVDKLSTDFHVKDGDVLGDGGLDDSGRPLRDMDASEDGAPGSSHGGSGGSGGGGTGGLHGDSGVVASDGGSIIDAGPPKPIAKFDFAPANVDPTVKAIATLDRADVNLDCASPSFDSSDLSFHDWCGPMPVATAITQAAGGDAALLVMGTLAIANGTTLQISGSRPVIFLVFGDAQIAGAIDAGGHGGAAGPGADIDCNPGTGVAGAKTSSGFALGAGGGSGGGFGSAGANAGGGGSNTSAAAGGAMSGEETLAPLRGGCSGGSGGLAADGATAGAAGGGGGALQIAAAGRLVITGSVLAGGGAGKDGAAKQAGGGGGGSGGAILLEGAPVNVDVNANVSANGGGGGGGQATSSYASAPGADGAAGTEAAHGGAASGSGGDGGDGASAASAAVHGSAGSLSGTGTTGAAGGGGGGLGRIRINQATTCLPAGTFSPRPSVGCDSCGLCAPPPEADCQALSRGSELYYLCPTKADASTARSKCEAVGMHRMKIEDQDENDWLASQISEDTWIGASDLDVEGDWRWDVDGAHFWSGAANGSAVDGSFTSWESGQPDDGPIAADCAVIGTDGLWSDHSSLLAYPYICE